MSNFKVTGTPKWDGVHFPSDRKGWDTSVSVSEGNAYSISQVSDICGTQYVVLSENQFMSTLYHCVPIEMLEQIIEMKKKGSE